MIDLMSCKLCVSCEVLYDESGPCPRCASEVFLWMGKVMRSIKIKGQAKAERPPLYDEVYYKGVEWLDSL